MPDYSQMVNALMQMGGGNAMLQPVAQRNPMQSKLLDPRGGTEGAVGYGGGASSAPARPRLVVAARMPDGTVQYGVPGDMHATLRNVSKIRDQDFGFAIPGGPFLTRAQAAKLVDEWPSIARKQNLGSDRFNALDSFDLHGPANSWSNMRRK
jgi:hypothetical protein